MATPHEPKVETLEQIIGHTFSLKHLIRLALTSAGANPDNYDGNRKLSQLGASVVDSVLAIIVFFIGGSRECTANLRKAFLNKGKYYAAAKRTGIDDCIDYDKRTGPNSPEVLRKAINAIIAAVFLDTWSIKTTVVVILRIFFQTSGDRMFRELPSASPATVEALASISKMILALNAGVINPSVLTIERSATTLEVSPMIHRFLEQGSKDPPLSSNAERIVTEKESVTEDLFQFLREEIWSSDGDLNRNGTETEAEHDSMATISDRPNAPSTPKGGQVARRQREPHNDSETCVVLPASKRRCRVASTNVSILHGEAAGQILLQERQQCAAQNMPPPENSYFSAAIVTKALKLEEDSLGDLAILLITIASPQSIVALREMMCCIRAQKTVDSHRLAVNVTKRRRYEMIKELNQKNALLRLLRWYHLLELFEQCGGSRTRYSMGYVNTTSADFEHPKRGAGNPSRKDDAKVAQAMMKELFPDLSPTSPVYAQEYAAIKYYRKVGQRLYILTDRFGPGILGLTLDPTHELEISDTMLLNPKNKTFRDFVDLLEESHGQWLRRCSDAAYLLLRPLLEFTLDNTAPFRLELTDPECIFKQPKCSESLLKLVA
ncbi:hypothetical protein BDQ94DRAFT_177759 [Aspergillus welwitschiae]|uniref:RNase III domain-containing protein n=1 Tax=Aspergillus welwitschiae TaxID=1341132 RepID=A0A3F3PHP6_9EURO|nr:hypothetical protein BDQ94DRAFT_177759 [Aspergillus welwitschiae]RDH26484.1 hypothetical protein BDQ94DRAFT_177759 [Aspergillus welwitschiae]